MMDGRRRKDGDDEEPTEREIKMTITKKSKRIGRPVAFINERAKILEAVPSQHDLSKSYIGMNPIHRTVQVAPVHSENTCNSEQIEFTNRGISHKEGGWPKEIDCQESDQVNRFLKKVEKDEGFLTTTIGLAKMMESKVKQNNAVEIYSDYFEFEDDATNCCEPEAKTVTVFCDPISDKFRRPVSSLTWCPDGGSRLAIGYCDPDFQSVWPHTPCQGYIFTVTDPTRHHGELACASPITSLQYNPKEEHQLAAGCHNGQVCWWDERLGKRPQGTISLDHAHVDPVYKIIWINSKTASELMTASTDGLIKWWDIRYFTEPTDSLVLDIENRSPVSRGDKELALCATCLEYEPTIPTKFMVGTQQGKVLACNRKAKVQCDIVVNKYQAHVGPVYALQRNPFCNKCFLTIGDWSAQIWSEDINESAIMRLRPGTESLTDGCWSPTRSSVFFTTRQDGFLEAWDIIYQQTGPILCLKLSDRPLHCLSVHPDGGLLLVGCGAGRVSLLELSDSLILCNKVDKTAVSAMFDRESRREKILGGLNKEAKLKAKKMQANLPAQPPQGKKARPEPVQEDPVEEAEKEFFNIINSEQQRRKEKNKPLVYKDDE